MPSEKALGTKFSTKWAFGSANLTVPGIIPALKSVAPGAGLVRQAQDKLIFLVRRSSKSALTSSFCSNLEVFVLFWADKYCTVPVKIRLSPHLPVQMPVVA
jgi:hypothetical protein